MSRKFENRRASKAFKNQRQKQEVHNLKKEIRELRRRGMDEASREVLAELLRKNR